MRICVPDILSADDSSRWSVLCYSSVSQNKDLMKMLLSYVVTHYLVKPFFFKWHYMTTNRIQQDKHSKPILITTPFCVRLSFGFSLVLVWYIYIYSYVWKKGTRKRRHFVWELTTHITTYIRCTDFCLLMILITLKPWHVFFCCSVICESH